MTRILKKILIAVDDTPASMTAVEQGLALAADDNAEVVFLHVVPIAGEKLVPGHGRAERVPGGARTKVLVTAAGMAESVDVPFTTALLVGYPPAQIALLAEELDVDLVVMGSRHMSGIKRFLLGSTSRALLGETTRPVLVVPEIALEPAPDVRTNGFRAVR